MASGGYDRAMISDRDTYDEAEWAASAGHGPLLASKPGEAFLIYRHWIWANLQRISFEQSFKSKETFDPPEMVMVGRGPIFMFVWYGLRARGAGTGPPQGSANDAGLSARATRARLVGRRAPQSQVASAGGIVYPHVSSLIGCAASFCRVQTLGRIASGRRAPTRRKNGYLPWLSLHPLLTAPNLLLVTLDWFFAWWE